MNKLLSLLLLTTLLGCTNIKLGIHDADTACSGSDLEEYSYRDRKVNIIVKCKKEQVQEDG